MTRRRHAELNVALGLSLVRSELDRRFAFLRTILIDGSRVLVISKRVVQIVGLTLLHVRIVEMRLGCWGIHSHLPENLPILRASFSYEESSGLLSWVDERKVVTSVYLVKLSDLFDII